MSAYALALIVLAGFVHVIPHAVMKRASDRTAFIWAMLGATCVFYAPVVFFSHAPSPRGWLFIAASAVVEVAYMYAVSRMYAHGDLAVAYPIARGSAPLFLLIPSIVFLHERPAAAGIAGIVLIAIGVFFLGVTPPLRSIGAWPLVAGMLTATYTAIDRQGVRVVEPMLYIYLVLLAGFLLYTPLALRQSGWTAMRSVPVRCAILGGITMPLAYVLVLIAMRSGALASYAGAVREVSVLVAFCVGVMAFGEKVTAARIGGALAILAGVVAIATA
ncbi:MAG TPA: DMT family transporter [Thermoanaerobaculia bacterium]|nr:DMT family transporter [Thermoanaerobaculia bacterium]